MKKVTVIIPAYNEESAIGCTLEELWETVKSHNWDIIVINDGSTDRTAEIVKAFTFVKLIEHPYNKGYGASLKTGIQNAETELVAFYDADGQHKPEDLQSMLNNMAQYDMLVGMRTKNSYSAWTRRPGKWVLAKVANYLSGRKIPDLNSGLRIVKKELIENMLHLFPQGFSFSTTSTLAFFNMGYNVGYHPITARKRIGQSTVKQLKHGSETLMLILRLIVLFNPLKVFLPVSFALILLGLVYEVFWGIILIERIKLIPGALLLFLSGLLIFFFGLLADQLSALRKQHNRR